MTHIEYERKRVLITVKTYPTPSLHYQETVCTAGITDDSKWIRLYPIRYRQLKNEQQYPLYSWVDVDVIKSAARDLRPESYHVDDNGITIIRKLDPLKDLQEKRRTILPLLENSIEELTSKYKKQRTSLGVLKPATVDDFIINKTKSASWTKNELVKLHQSTIFDTKNDINELEKMPYEFSYRYKCDNPKCNGHTQRILSWEINQAFRNYRKHYADDVTALGKLKDKYLGFFDKKNDGYLFVGTTYPNDKFVVIGHFSCPIKNLSAYISQIPLLE